MDDVLYPHCAICWAVIPRALMHFHRDWHDAQDGGGPRQSERYGAQAELNRLIRVIDTLRSIPALPAPMNGVAELREKLMATALELAVHNHR